MPMAHIARHSRCARPLLVSSQVTTTEAKISIRESSPNPARAIGSDQDDCRPDYIPAAHDVLSTWLDIPPFAATLT